MAKNTVNINNNYCNILINHFIEIIESICIYRKLVCQSYSKRIWLHKLAFSTFNTLINFCCIINVPLRRGGGNILIFWWTPHLPGTENTATKMFPSKSNNCVSPVTISNVSDSLNSQNRVFNGGLKNGPTVFWMIIVLP